MNLPLSIRRRILTAQPPGDSVASNVRPRIDPRVRFVQQTIAVRAISTANTREHWAARHRRAKEHRTRVHSTFASLAIPPLPVVVTMTRIAPSVMDSDNLTISMKSIRDAIADLYGVDDADPRYVWRCEQERGVWAVRIEIRSIPIEVDRVVRQSERQHEEASHVH